MCTIIDGNWAERSYLCMRSRVFSNGIFSYCYYHQVVAHVEPSEQRSSLGEAVAEQLSNLHCALVECDVSCART